RGAGRRGGALDAVRRGARARAAGEGPGRHCCCGRGASRRRRRGRRRWASRPERGGPCRGMGPWPADGVLEAQLGAFRERLSQDRILKWLYRQRELNRRIALMSQPRQEPVEVEELHPASVQAVFDSLTVDPARELAEIREARTADSLGLHLERMLALRPPPSVRETLCGGALRVLLVQGPGGGLQGQARVLYEAPSGVDRPALQARLQEAAPAVSRALARQLMLTVAPRLHFEPAPEGPPSTLVAARPTLWRTAKRERREAVHGAMRSWVADMNW
ncbi:unnamed protein product, partial [Prorocentrum cordatum]